MSIGPARMRDADTGNLLYQVEGEVTTRRGKQFVVHWDFVTLDMYARLTGESLVDLSIEHEDHLVRGLE